MNARVVFFLGVTVVYMLLGYVILNLQEVHLLPQKNTDLWTRWPFWRFIFYFILLKMKAGSHLYLCQGVHLCTSLEFAMETFEHDDMFFLQKTNLQCPVAPTLGVFFGTVHCGITWLSWMTGVWTRSLNVHRVDIPFRSRILSSSWERQIDSLEKKHPKNGFGDVLFAKLFFCFSNPWSYHDIFLQQGMCIVMLHDWVAWL